MVLCGVLDSKRDVHQMRDPIDRHITSLLLAQSSFQHGLNKSQNESIVIQIE